MMSIKAEKLKFCFLGKPYNKTVVNLHRSAINLCTQLQKFMEGDWFSSVDL